MVPGNLVTEPLSSCDLYRSRPLRTTRKNVRCTLNEWLTRERVPSTYLDEAHNGHGKISVAIDGHLGVYLFGEKYRSLKTEKA